MYERILLPIDTSDGSRRAAQRGLALAASHGADVYGIHVVDTRRYGEPARSSVELVVDELEDRGNELLSALRDRAAGEGLDVTVRCCHGLPADEIVAYADAVGADLIVLGMTGESGRSPGSVVERVLRTAGSEVLAV